MKFVLVLCALVAVAAASYAVNTAAQDSNSNYNKLPNPGYNRAYDEFDHPSRRHHRYGGRRHHSRSSSDSSDSDSDSDSSSDSSSGSHSRSSSESGSYEDRGYIVYAPPAQAPAYGGASNDAPAQTVYGAPAQDNGAGY
ncbi:hypothetical protein GCK72_024099 [Caenorhabditis remanei]|uniref:Uncharacterized protein n=2 Tax=Caenorhabditis remanei TaxID=31234 RepID=E3LCD4_CAERE|nr:hypothetical protein GCK72_024099 [Caenorhabditis remanei]EFO82565.1 hypothetical protein CRE_00894 [Caenorhabditis remanei]KAF1747634.1 hypothetical protein GCK72_024099 [Caenorhabditis remanei]